MNYVIQSISRLYEWFVEVDLEAGTYRYMLNKSPVEEDILFEGKYNLLKQYILNSVREQTDKIKMERFMDVFYIERHLDAAIEAGMNGHIGKPIHVKKMNREINRVLTDDTDKG